MGIYVYAIGCGSATELPPLEGISGQPVYRLAVGPVAAIASDCGLETVRAERRHLSANQRVLKALGEQLDLLPMAFGTVARSRAALAGFLTENSEALTAQLQHVAGRTEMSLRLSLDVPDAIAYLVQRTPELSVARDRVFGRHKPPSYDDRIRLGQLCDEALRRYRDAQTAQTLHLLEPHCAQIKTLPVGHEQEIANLAMLVARDGIAAFEAAVDTIAAQLPDELAFTVAGPWPPHNFVQLEL